MEGIEMRQRSCKVRRLLFLKRYWLFQHTAVIFILEQKEGEIGKQWETERECVQVWERSTKTDSASVVKLTVGKNPVDQFWDKLGRISIFWGNYFNGGLIEKIHKR